MTTMTIDAKERDGAFHWFATDETGKMVLWDATPHRTGWDAQVAAADLHRDWRDRGYRAPYGTWA